MTTEHGIQYLYIAGNKNIEPVTDPQEQKRHLSNVMLIYKWSYGTLHKYKARSLKENEQCL